MTASIKKGENEESKLCDVFKGESVLKGKSSKSRSKKENRRKVRKTLMKRTEAFVSSFMTQCFGEEIFKECFPKGVSNEISTKELDKSCILKDTGRPKKNAEKIIDILSSKKTFTGDCKEELKKRMTIKKTVLSSRKLSIGLKRPRSSTCIKAGIKKSKLAKAKDHPSVSEISSTADSEQEESESSGKGKSTDEEDASWSGEIHLSDLNEVKQDDCESPQNSSVESRELENKHRIRTTNHYGSEIELTASEGSC